MGGARGRQQSDNVSVWSDEGRSKGGRGAGGGGGVTSVGHQNPQVVSIAGGLFVPMGQQGL